MENICVFQDYDKYTEEDHQTWSILAKRQRKVHSASISKEYLIGFEKLELDEDRIVRIAEMSTRLQRVCGWSLMPVTGLIPPKDFFLMLQNKQYPITVTIRKPWEIDFSEQPDIFHDIYGHLPLLVNEKFTRFLSAYSAIAYRYANNERAMELMARLYWFTYEMGVINEENDYKPYGGAIITSVEESNNIFNRKAAIHPFDLSDIFNTAFNPYELQKEYFVINSFDDLFTSLKHVEVTLIRFLACDRASEEHRLLVTFNETMADYPKDKTVVNLFEEQVLKTPEAVAVVFKSEQLSYQELDQRANQLANYLVGKGIKEESLVPLCIERSVEMIVGILGILKAGGVYVPIDPSLPTDRIEYMLEDTKACAIVTKSVYGPAFSLKQNCAVIQLDKDWERIEQEVKRSPNTPISSAQLVYIIYTSGTTGKPKGVMVEHSALVNLCLDHISEFSMTEADNYLQFMSTSFDGSILDIFMTLLSGATLVLPDKEVVSNTNCFIDFISKNQISIFTITPSYLSILNKPELPCVRTIISAGEAAIVEDALYYSKFKNFYNGYGPSEVTVNATLFKVAGSAENAGTTSIPIGKPRSNKRIYILNSDGGLSTIGAAGEIYIAGSGLARGYLNRADLTADKFIADPFSDERGNRMYKTGDLGRWLPDGNIEYLGRLDDQVKINGYRIELAEIETVLQQCELVRQAVVVCYEDNNDNKQLVGYVVAKGLFNKEAIWSYLAGRLPQYMVPALLINLESLPLTVNGKVDRKALPPVKPADAITTPYVAPMSEAEKLLAEIWQDLLKIEQVGVKDNFFELGGHSLLVLQAVNRIRKLGINIEAKDLFAYETIAQQSKFLSRSLMLLNAASEGRLVLPIQSEGEGIPLFAIPEFLLYSKIGNYISKDQPFYSMERSPYKDREDVVADYLSEMKKNHPHGPYILAGYCQWGEIAIDMANALIAAGEEVPALILIECYSPKALLPRTSLKFIRPKTKAIFNTLKNLPTFEDKRKLIGKELSYAVEYVNKKLTTPFLRKNANQPIAKYPGNVILIKASETFGIKDDGYMGWSECFTGTVKTFTVTGEHLGIMLGSSSAFEIAEILNSELGRINKSNTGSDSMMRKNKQVLEHQVY